MVKYKGTEFYINLDAVNKPDIGFYLEIKSRTWSRRDATAKSNMVVDLINYLEASPEQAISRDYFDLVRSGIA